MQTCDDADCRDRMYPASDMTIFQITSKKIATIFAHLAQSNHQNSYMQLMAIGFCLSDKTIS